MKLLTQEQVPHFRPSIEQFQQHKEKLAMLAGEVATKWTGEVAMNYTDRRSGSELY